MYKILVIEDNALFLKAFLFLFEEKGWQVIGTQTGRLGLQLAKEQMPDLIICDVNIPGIDGFDILKALRHDLVTQEIPFIFLTAEPNDRDRLRALKLGADDYLDKFLPNGELIHAIATQLKLINLASV